MQLPILCPTELPSQLLFHAQQHVQQQHGGTPQRGQLLLTGVRKVVVVVVADEGGRAAHSQLAQQPAGREPAGGYSINCISPPKHARLPPTNLTSQALCPRLAASSHDVSIRPLAMMSASGPPPQHPRCVAVANAVLCRHRRLQAPLLLHVCNVFLQRRPPLKASVGQLCVCGTGSGGVARGGG